MNFPDQISLNWTYFFFLQNFAEPSPNFFPETWSLAVEEWFYLLFPLALVLALRIAPKAWQAWAVVIGFFLLTPAIFRLCHALQTTHNVDVVLQFVRNEWDASPRKVVVLRFDAVIYGVFAAALAAWKPVIWRRLAALWPLGSSLILLATVSLAFNAPLDRASPLQGWALLPLISCGFVLLLPACSHWAEQPRLWTRSVSWVAKISYSLYLCHGLVLLSLGKWFGPNSAFPLHRETWIWCIAVWIVSVAVASAVYRWFEKPMMDQRDRVKSKATMNAPAVSTGLSADQAR